MMTQRTGGIEKVLDDFLEFGMKILLGDFTAE
jgi:hypothetical protein